MFGHTQHAYAFVLIYKMYKGILKSKHLIPISLSSSHVGRSAVESCVFLLEV